MKEGLFTKIKEFFVGESAIEEYGGEVGGFRYLILYDKTRDEILGHYITPPKKSSRSVGGRLDALGTTLGVDYKSEFSYEQTFAVMNKDATLKISRSELESKINEQKAQNEPELRALSVYEIPKDGKFFAGSYITSAGANIVREPKFEAHFEELSQQMKFGLAFWLEFITELMYVTPVIQEYKRRRRKNQYKEPVFRSAIFLHDAVKEELKIHVSYNMSKYTDDMISFPLGVGFVSYVYNRREPIILTLKQPGKILMAT